MHPRTEQLLQQQQAQLRRGMQTTAESGARGEVQDDMLLLVLHAHARRHHDEAAPDAEGTKRRVRAGGRWFVDPAQLRLTGKPGSNERVEGSGQLPGLAVRSRTGRQVEMNDVRPA